MDRVFVVGAGLMGRGIAQVCAQAGLETTVCDVSEAQLEEARASISQGFGKLSAKGRLAPAEADAALRRLRFTTALDPVAESDYVIEAVTEQKGRKFELFRALDARARAGVTLATNTSSISITEIAAHTARPERVVGVHFMNPVPLMPLVEIIRGQLTVPEVVEEAHTLVRRLGKTSVEANDYPGFISNRIFMAMLNEAYTVVYEGVGTIEDVDATMRLAFNHPMGPLELSDLVGLDTILNVMEVLYEAYRDARFRPCPLLVRLVRAGRHGRKSGAGFYTYRDGQKVIVGA